MDPDSKTEAAIRQRAYELWESQGRQGDPLDHWFQAKWEFEKMSGKTQDSKPVSANARPDADSEEPPTE